MGMYFAAYVGSRRLRLRPVQPLVGDAAT